MKRLSIAGKQADTAMKFVLVNHRTPADASSCIECSRRLERSYLRDVSTQRHYCDHDCYLQYEAKSLSMSLLMPILAPWFAAARTDPQPAAPYPAPLQLMTAMAAATCWCTIAFAKSALRVSELMAADAFDI
jgi:hypothetical protein